MDEELVDLINRLNCEQLLELSERLVAEEGFIEIAEHILSRIISFRSAIEPY